jgi:hypothetical protein
MERLLKITDTVANTPRHVSFWAIIGNLVTVVRQRSPFADRFRRMAQTTADGTGQQTSASLTHGQMARALRIAAERGEEARGAGWAWVEAPAAAEHGGAPPIATGAGHGHARVRAGSTITFAMLVAGTLVAAQLSGNEGGFVGGVASGARGSGSIPGNAARPRGGDAVAGSRQEQPEMLKKFTSVAVSVGAAAAIAGSAGAQAVQWRAADGGNGHWYGISAEYTNWTEARVRALAAGGDLASLSTNAEWFWVRGWLPSILHGYWLGGRQQPNSATPSSGWFWLTGEPVQTEWMVMDDNSCGASPADVENMQQDYLHTCCENYPQGISFGDLDDGGWGCDIALRSVVEWSADCNNDGIVDYGQIRAGQLIDANGNNVPDCCEQGTSCDSLAVGLQARYMFDGNCADASGYGRNGAATGIAYVAGTAGLPASAASFDGSASFVEVDGVPIPTDNAFSWALWLRADSIGSTAVIERIATIGNNQMSPSLFIRSGGGLGFGSYSFSSGGTSIESGPATISPGIWSHIACTSSIDGARRIYVNGVLVVEGLSVDYGQQLPKILIGRDRLDCCERFRGVIDDLRFYSRPLSATEVATLHALGAPCIGDIYIDQRVDGGDLGVLLSHWGPTTVDSASIACDLNRDGRVDGFDLGMLLANWGPCGN